MATDASDASDRDAQRRELEEIRRKFTEMGARVGSLFDPAPGEDPDTEDPTPPPAVAALPPPAAPSPMVVVEPARGLSRMAVAAVAVALLAGTGLGWLLHSEPDPPAAASPTSPPVATPTSVPPRTRTVVPPACLETARKGDQAIHYLTINVRDARLVQTLKAYTLASQACRREASP